MAYREKCCLWSRKFSINCIEDFAGAGDIADNVRGANTVNTTMKLRSSASHFRSTVSGTHMTYPYLLSDPRGKKRWCEDMRGWRCD